MNTLSRFRRTAPRFPDPVPPSSRVDRERRTRLKQLTGVMRLGIGLRLFIIAAELLGFYFARSSALLVDMVATLFDVFSSLILLAAIYFAARPPDDDHPFGHGRAEPLAGFQLALLMCGTGLVMTGHYLWTLGHPLARPELPFWLWILPALAAVALALTAGRLRRAGTTGRSPALLTEAAHFQIDAWTSLLAALSLAGAVIFPHWSEVMDRGGAALLAGAMLLLGARAIRENLNQLLDRAPQAADFERVRNAALKIEGVIDVEKVRIQHAGPDAHVDIDIEVDPLTSVATSHLMTQQVRAEIQSEWPAVREVVVHVEPYYEGDH